MINKFITKEDKPFFVGLLIMNIIIFFIANIFIINPPEFIKKQKQKHKYVEKEKKNENSR